MLMILALLLALGAGLIAGVFLAFSSFVMKALDQLPAPAAVAAMQRINVVVLNPLFLGILLGTALLSVAVIGVALTRWGDAGAGLLLTASLHYLLGCFGVTAACNVPRNERLARLPADSAEAAAYWPRYLREWLAWNHIRTVASTIAAAGAAAALAA